MYLCRHSNIFGPIMEHVDNKVSLIPDFNLIVGMARVLHTSWKESRIDRWLFHDTSGNN
jgi:hypothetical protein